MIEEIQSFVEEDEKLRTVISGPYASIEEQIAFLNERHTAAISFLLKKVKELDTRLDLLKGEVSDADSEKE